MARTLTAGLTRVGCVVLDSDLSFEPDLAMAFQGRVGVHITRLRYDGAVTPVALRSALDSVVETSKILLPLKPSMLLYACTSGSFIGGPNIAVEIENELSHLGAVGMTAISAVVRSMRELNLKRVAVLSPYSAQVTYLLEKYLETVGVTVDFVHLIFGDRVVDDVTLQSLNARDLMDAVRKVPETSDGIFISCTGIRIMPNIEELELSAGRPVLSSNLAIIRAISKHAGQPVAVKSRLTELPTGSGHLCHKG